MVEITITSPIPSTPPADGWKVDYRIKGSGSAFTNAIGSPFTELPIVFTTDDPTGTLYEVRVWRDCGDLESSKFTKFTPCSCVGEGYVIDATQEECEKTESIPATVTNSGYCLAASTNEAYSNFPARIYKVGFSNATLLLPTGTSDSNIHGELSANPQWCNPTVNPSLGPMNREGVWIDNNCDGNKDALVITSGPLVIGATYVILTYFAGDDFTNLGAFINAEGEIFVASGTTPTTWTNGSILGIKETTVAFSYNNIGIARTVYIGIGGDNQFKLVANGVVVADTGNNVNNVQFKIWHLIPVTLNVGINYFNAIALGDGSPDDSIAMVIYDNTIAQLEAATNDSSLTILFKTSTLRGTTYDVATCPATYNLDTSGGSGNYTCKKVLTKPCNTIA